MGKIMQKGAKSRTSLRFSVGVALVAAFLSLPASAAQGPAISEDSLGLYNFSVQEDRSPDAIQFKGGDPGTNKRIEKSYHTAPPMVPHSNAGFLPITRESNLCKECHFQPGMIGMKLEAGMPVPMPASHYADVKKEELYMGRWNCMQCHQEQADVKVLVNSTFGKAVKKGR